ncbi:hypothetical protein HCC14_10495 [Streptococcus suis]|nr:hypothetical protein [Streptococcus suis]
MAVRSAANKERTYLDSHCLALYCGVGARQYFGGQALIEKELKKDCDFWIAVALERAEEIDYWQTIAKKYEQEIQLLKNQSAVRQGKSIISWK